MSRPLVLTPRLKAPQPHDAYLCKGEGDLQGRGAPRVRPAAPCTPSLLRLFAPALPRPASSPPHLRLLSLLISRGFPHACPQLAKGILAPLGPSSPRTQEPAPPLLVGTMDLHPPVLFLLWRPRSPDLKFNFLNYLMFKRSQSDSQQGRRQLLESLGKARVQPPSLYLSQELGNSTLSNLPKNLPPGP